MPGNKACLTVSMNLSLDGFLSGPEGELDWHFTHFTRDMEEAMLNQLADSRLLLLGRLTCEAMACYWPVRQRQPFLSAEQAAFARLMNDFPKIFFSRSKKPVSWQNTHVSQQPLLPAIRRLKSTATGPLLLYGSGRLAHALIAAGEVDAFDLWIHPVALGAGRRLFPAPATALQLKSLQSFSSGVVRCHYETQTSSFLPAAADTKETRSTFAF